VLDQKPLQVMQRAGRPVDLADGRARVEARIGLPLRDGLTLADVDYSASGELIDVRSDLVVAGRHLEGAALEVAANRDGLRIDGPLRVGRVPVDVAWQKRLGPGGGEAPGEVSGT